MTTRSRRSSGTPAQQPSRLRRIFPSFARAITTDPSRQAQWRRRRVRRLIAAALAGVAVLLLAGALRAAPAATHRVAVVTHDLSPGDQLGAADLSEREWPDAAGVPGLVTVSTATGAYLTAAIRAGEPVSVSRIRGTGNWPGVPAGLVVLPIPVSERIADAVQGGDRVDLISGLDTGTALSASSVLVLASAPGKKNTSGLTADPATRSPTLWLAVSPATARQIARTGQSATAQDRFTIAIHPG
jgi:pilus assembly protein CpaB